MYIARRKFLTALGIGTLGVAGVLAQDEVPATCSRANGAGSYLVGPYDPLESGSDPVYLTADMGFDETMAFCNIRTNFAAFIFPTATMGPIELGMHEFYMDMHSTSIGSVSITDSPDGPSVNMAGVLRVETRIGSGSQMQTFIEDNVSFGCQGTDLNSSPRVEATATNFAMTVNFDPLRDHAAIFGATATFEGHLTQGNIIIVL